MAEEPAMPVQQLYADIMEEYQVRAECFESFQVLASSVDGLGEEVGEQYDEINEVLEPHMRSMETRCEEVQAAKHKIFEDETELGTAFETMTSLKQRRNTLVEEVEAAKAETVAVEADLAASLQAVTEADERLPELRTIYEERRQAADEARVAATEFTYPFSRVDPEAAARELRTARMEDRLTARDKCIVAETNVSAARRALATEPAKRKEMVTGLEAKYTAVQAEFDAAKARVDTIKAATDETQTELATLERQLASEKQRLMQAEIDVIDAEGVMPFEAEPSDKEASFRKLNDDVRELTARVKAMELELSRGRARLADDRRLSRAQDAVRALSVRKKCALEEKRYYKEESNEELAVKLENAKTELRAVRSEEGQAAEAVDIADTQRAMVRAGLGSPSAPTRQAALTAFRDASAAATVARLTLSTAETVLASNERRSVELDSRLRELKSIVTSRENERTVLKETKWKPGLEKVHELRSRVQGYREDLTTFLNELMAEDTMFGAAQKLMGTLGEES